jgi:hypothetical protein
MTYVLAQIGLICGLFQLLLQENSDKFRVFPNMLDLSLEGCLLDGE